MSNELSSYGVVITRRFFSSNGRGFPYSGVTLWRAFVCAFALALGTIKLGTSSGLFLVTSNGRWLAIFGYSILVCLYLVTVGTEKLIAMGFGLDQFVVAIGRVFDTARSFIIAVIFYVIDFKDSWIVVTATSALGSEKSENSQSTFKTNSPLISGCTHGLIL